jgi:hypothetical protein
LRSGELDVGPLAAAEGPYRIEVADYYRTCKGLYHVGIQRLTKPCDSFDIACDAPYRGTIESALDSDLFSFMPVRPNLTIIVAKENPSQAEFSPYWRLLKADGTVFYSWRYGELDVGPLSAADAPYRIEVADYYRTYTGRYIVRVVGLDDDCDGRSFRRGYANDDGECDVSDAVFILGYLFQRTAAPSCLKAADVNDDGSLNIADAVGLLSYLFASGPKPPAPFDVCGTDGTLDSLTCLSFPRCP